MSEREISVEVVAAKILLIRGRKVMLDRDLAELYGVETKALNQAVKRNRERFPDDFMFRLLLNEKEALVTNCDRFSMLKHSSSMPYAFTEQGVAMLSSVLNSARAIEVNIAIMRAFVKLRELLMTHKELAQKIDDLERKYQMHEADIQVIFQAIKKLLEPPDEPPRPRFGMN
ncbi:MAG TPA: ORF6N domain-containing protein [Candidatus Omnitrophota bacterium]|nr:ORF6N domain-containing protein [Candidatus Omnitrophota bacterium]